jgi:hypothetical protein
MQGALVVPVGVKTYVGLFDNEHSATRPHDQIQLACRELFEFERFPVH